MVETRTLVTLSSFILGTSFIGYCVYFDHRRRHDPHFRHRLEKLHNQRTTGKGNSSLSLNGGGGGGGGGEKQPKKSDLEEAVREVRISNAEFAKAGLSPQTLERRFMEDIAIGEQLAQRGETLKAATSFYRATAFYPAPRDLLALYESSLPPEVFMLVMQLMQIDMTLPQNGKSTTSSTSPKGKKGGKTKSKKKNQDSSPIQGEAILEEIISTPASIEGYDASSSISKKDLVQVETEIESTFTKEDGSRPSTPSSLDSTGISSNDSSHQEGSTVVGQSYVQVENENLNVENVPIPVPAQVEIVPDKLD